MDEHEKNGRLIILIVALVIIPLVPALLWLVLSGIVSFALLDWVAITSTPLGRASLAAFTLSAWFGFSKPMIVDWQDDPPLNWRDPRLQGLWCAFGRHDWADDPSHWRRWCRACGHGTEPPPPRPRGEKRRNSAIPEAKSGSIDPAGPTPAPRNRSGPGGVS